MAFTIVTEAEQQFMAGENVDATGDVQANHQFLHDYAAGYLSGILKYDIIANWGSLDAVIKFMLTEWAARLAGMTLITYNMRSYTSRVEAEDMINVHAFRMLNIEKQLEKSSVINALGVK